MKKCLAIMLVLAAAAPAMATFSSTTLVTEYTDGAGMHWRINGTDVDLFEPTAPYNPSGVGTDYWSNNNMCPVDYPNVSPIYVPSPGTYGDYSLAEHSDLEGLFYSYNSNNGGLKVWLVTSAGPNGFLGFDNYYHVGDVFVNTDGDDAFEYALLSFGTKPGLTAGHYVWRDGYGNYWGTSNLRSAGDLAAIDSDSDLHGINGPNSWAGSSSIRGLIDPWAANHPDDIVYSSDLLYQEITGAAINERDFASGPPGYPPSGTHSTFVYLWDVIMPDWETSGLTMGDFSFHVAQQCGNDVLDGGTPVMPVPSSALLGLFGLALAALSKRKIAA